MNWGRFGYFLEGWLVFTVTLMVIFGVALLAVIFIEWGLPAKMTLAYVTKGLRGIIIGAGLTSLLTAGMYKEK